MNIIIAGCGKVGSTLLRKLAAEGHDLTLIDLKKATLESALLTFRVTPMATNFPSAPVLR